MGDSVESTAIVRAPHANLADADYRYIAFISYRHEPVGRKWAVWLHNAIEKYPIPNALARQRGCGRRPGRVFRDEEEVHASAQLYPQIQEALKASKFLVVICTPRTPHSKWVRDEIADFRSFGRADRILSLLVEGEPHESFPEPLREIRTSLMTDDGSIIENIDEIEPLAADVRPNTFHKHSTMQELALMRLLAAMLQVRFDELRRRDWERKRRLFRYVTCGCLIVATVMAYLAMVAHNEAILVKAMEYGARLSSLDATRSQRIASAAATRAIQARDRAESMLGERKWEFDHAEQSIAKLKLQVDELTRRLAIAAPVPTPSTATDSKATPMQKKSVYVALDETQIQEMIAQVKKDIDATQWDAADKDLSQAVSEANHMHERDPANEVFTNGLNQLALLQSTLNGHLQKRAALDSTPESRSSASTGRPTN